MNESEILSELKSALEWVSEDDNPKGKIAIRISSIREIIKILEKRGQIKKVLADRQCEVRPYHYERKGFCPKCHQEVKLILNRNYCGFCGQELKWND